MRVKYKIRDQHGDGSTGSYFAKKINMMDYQLISPTIYLEDSDLWLLNAELNNLTLEQLGNVIKDFECVFNDDYNASSFGLEAINVSFNKEKAVVDHYGETIKEINSADIYMVLKDYFTKLQAWNHVLQEIARWP
jgi:hypothetical protein